MIRTATRETHRFGWCLALLVIVLAIQSGAQPDEARSNDVEWVRALLKEDLGGRRFDFATIVHATSGKKVIPLDRNHAVHQQMLGQIERALAETILEHNHPDSPVRRLRRINEASRIFEDGLIERLNRIEGLSCVPAPTIHGINQRSGYPDIRLTDHATGTVFYLDPKLVQQGSESSTFRTFYFEPKSETSKITDDAVHLILGIEHDGNARQWTFHGWRIVCLSNLSVRLKAEFQASNADLYGDSALSSKPESP